VISTGHRKGGAASGRAEAAEEDYIALQPDNPFNAVCAAESLEWPLDRPGSYGTLVDSSARSLGSFRRKTH
jgi:hypothetical protein